jgi:hypothetical protein
MYPWPKDENVIELWLRQFQENSNITGFSPQYFKVNKNMRICNLHFESNCFHEVTRRMVKNAVPTIFHHPPSPSLMNCMVILLYIWPTLIDRKN